MVPRITKQEIVKLWSHQTLRLCRKFVCSGRQAPRWPSSGAAETGPYFGPEFHLGRVLVSSTVKLEFVRPKQLRKEILLLLLVAIIRYRFGVQSSDARSRGI